MLQDEGVDSDDDDDTSLSSYGSDLSSRKGYSASALSLTDVSWMISFLLSVFNIVQRPIYHCLAKLVNSPKNSLLY